LLEVSLQAVRGGHAAGDGTLSALTEKASEIWTVVVERWNALDATQRGTVAAGGGGILVLLVAFSFWRGRRRRRLAGEQWASMAAPSKGFSDHVAIDRDDPDYGDEEGDGAFEEAGAGYSGSRRR
jgi:hypothetical protein